MLKLVTTKPSIRRMGIDGETNSYQDQRQKYRYHLDIEGVRVRFILQMGWEIQQDRYKSIPLRENIKKQGQINPAYTL